jgi:hypothetical protein
MAKCMQKNFPQFLVIRWRHKYLTQFNATSAAKVAIR